MRYCGSRLVLCDGNGLSNSFRRAEVRCDGKKTTDTRKPAQFVVGMEWSFGKGMQMLVPDQIRGAGLGTSQIGPGRSEFG
jgi:hypothetical protein